jgi:cell envelope opacity-associated protein A
MERNSNEVNEMTKATITNSDRVMSKFKGMTGVVVEICKDGAVIEFELALNKYGQKTLFFRFDQFNYTS